MLGQTNVIKSLLELRLIELLPCKTCHRYIVNAKSVNSAEREARNLNTGNVTCWNVKNSRTDGKGSAIRIEFIRQRYDTSISRVFFPSRVTSTHRREKEKVEARRFLLASALGEIRRNLVSP